MTRLFRLLMALTFLAAPTLQAKDKKINWQHIEFVTVLSQEWVTPSERTVFVPQRQTEPCPQPAVIAGDRRGTTNTEIYNRVCVPSSRTTSIPMTVSDRGYFVYRLETETTIYDIASRNRLNVTINRAMTRFGWDKKNIYIVQDDGSVASVGILKEEAK